MGSIYGVTFYGTDKYGLTPPPNFSATNFLAEVDPLSYSSVRIAWLQLGGSWDRVRLVRNAYGFPTDATDGRILLDSATNPGSVADTLVNPLRFYYYSLFLRDAVSQLYSRAADSVVLVPKDYSYSERLFDLLPSIYQDNDGFFVFGDPASPMGPLQSFLSLFGYELDVLRSEYDTLLWVNQADKVAGGLLPHLTGELGFPYEAELGMRLARLQALNAIYLFKAKGTRPGIEGAVSVLTGWAPIVALGPNLLLGHDDASFDHGVGRWSEYSNVALSTSFI